MRTESITEREPLIENGSIDGTYYGTAVADPNNEVFHCHGLRMVPQAESNSKAKKVLWISIMMCLGFMIAEVIGGIWAQSLAIITDAAHLLTDFASMMISLFSLYIASRPPSQRMSFGWHRAVLVFLAIQRMIAQTYEINATVMAITAGVGVIVNIAMGMTLFFGGGHGHHHGHSHGHSHTNSNAVDSHDHSHGTDENGGGGEEHNINVRAAFIHVLGDLIQSIGVLIAALLILWNEDWAIADPICTLMFSVIVLFTTIYIIRDALVVLLEGRPSSIDFRTVLLSLENIKGVKKVHDLRIWALTMDKIAISVHLEIDPDAQDAQEILRETTTMLRNQYGAHETT
uniref:Uncharacterized protein n=2 Tax=Panagrolaimus sp. PS1159 TaxID=55785 RepID=A0AC35G7P5_9BILA